GRSRGKVKPSMNEYIADCARRQPAASAWRAQGERAAVHLFGEMWYPAHRLGRYEMMRKLKIDLGDLAFAFENGSWEMANYLDRQTGEILLVTEETRGLVEDALEEAGDREVEPEELANLVRAGGAPEWQVEAALDAARVEVEPSRYLAVPRGDSHEGYRDME